MTAVAGRTYDLFSLPIVDLLQELLWPTEVTGKLYPCQLTGRSRLDMEKATQAIILFGNVCRGTNQTRCFLTSSR